MAGREFSDYESMVAAAEDALAGVLVSEVAAIAEKILQVHILTAIYAVDKRKEGGWVNDTTYQRRGELVNTVYSELEDKSTLLITANGAPNTPIIPGHSVSGAEGGFLALLELGPWGISGSQFPRPAVSRAQAEMNVSPQIAAAIRNGIQRVIG